MIGIGLTPTPPLPWDFPPHCCFFPWPGVLLTPSVTNSDVDGIGETFRCSSEGARGCAGGVAAGLQMSTSAAADGKQRSNSAANTRTHAY